VSDWHEQPEGGYTVTPAVGWADALPEKMKHLARDERRKVPIPVMNVNPVGEVNFAVVSNEKVIQCGRDRECGICGKPLDYWIAFVGGPISAKNGAYSDPPFHKECAMAAMQFCPHLARKVHRRTADEKMPDGSWKSEGAVEDKPAQWIIGLTRDYTMLPWGKGVLFKCNVRHRIAYEYDDKGNLQVIGGS
jgi:hypothetical protein